MCDAAGSVAADFTITISEDDRHNDGCNYGFADGHVKWDRPERVDIRLQ
jgi:prepilin-type processing-associated H-X9-DG protein